MTDQTFNNPVPTSIPERGRLLSSDVRLGTALPVWAVFKREFALYFRSPLAYAIGFAVLFFLGVLFNSYVTQVNGQYPADAGYAPALLTFLTFLIAPLLTMRLLSEESREGTLEVLMTLPMGEGSFVIGKFLAAWGYYTILLLLTLVYVVILNSIGVPDFGTAFGAYIGAWLYGGAAIAVALIWSSVTEDQVVAAFLSAATLLVLYLADAAASLLSSSPLLADIVREIGFRAHYDATMSRGIIRLQDVLFFLFVIIGALFITTRIVESRRWRG